MKRRIGGKFSVEDVLAGIIGSATALVAHPDAGLTCPVDIKKGVR